LEEVKSDYHRIINAESLQEGSKAYREFVVKWKKLVPKVVVSLEEAGEKLLTFYGFLTAMEIASHH
jgi:transposase-like protein